jgi:hypothetical protein
MLLAQVTAARSCLITLGLLVPLALIVAVPIPAADKPPEVVKVEKDRITFEPARFKEGEASLPWALGSVRVRALGHKADHCLFELLFEVEQGYTVYACRVPLDSLPVSIAIAKGRLTTSFDLTKCEVVRTGNFRHDQNNDDLPFQQQNIDGTSFCNHFRDTAVGKGATAEAGKKVKMEISVYTGWSYDTLRTKKIQEVEFVLGKDEAGKGVNTAVTGMRVGTIRQVAIREEMTGREFQALVPDVVDNKQIFFAFKLVAVEGK